MLQQWFLQTYVQLHHVHRKRPSLLTVVLCINMCPARLGHLLCTYNQNRSNLHNHPAKHGYSARAIENTPSCINKSLSACQNTAMHGTAQSRCLNRMVRLQPIPSQQTAIRFTVCYITKSATLPKERAGAENSHCRINSLLGMGNSMHDHPAMHFTATSTGHSQHTPILRQQVPHSLSRCCHSWHNPK